MIFRPEKSFSSEIDMLADFYEFFLIRLITGLNPDQKEVQNEWEKAEKTMALYQ